VNSRCDTSLSFSFNLDARETVALDRKTVGTYEPFHIATRSDGYGLDLCKPIGRAGFVQGWPRARWH
jgi:hypothetical protein